MKNKGTNPVCALCLLLTSVIWGTAFVAQSVGMDYIGPFTFNGTRSLIGALSLLPVVLVRRSHAMTKTDSDVKRRTVFAGIVCGVILAAASNLQQIGLLYTSVGKSGFVTAMYIVLVPVFGLFLGKKTTLNTWISVVLAVVGLYLLCMNESFSFARGDVLTLMCAVVFSFHILAVDTLVVGVDGVAVSCIQFLTCAAVSGICMLIFEQPSANALWEARIPLLYAGVMSCGVAYTLQIIGQQGVEPAIASLLMSMESVVAVIAGWLILGQGLSARELSGCLIMFAAIILTQIPVRKK